MNMTKRITGFIAIAIIVIAVIAIILNREWIYDFWRGIGYEPVAEVEQMRDDLRLTDRGVFLFNASRPELMSRDSFNETCRSDEDAESAVLGCYTDKTVYVYDIVDDELKGIRELTLAHELLHAVWERMDDGKRSELKELLLQVLANNQELLGEELDNYDNEQKQEELYVRAGTEIKNLPDKLEKHYAEIFQNQDGVVDFYNSYIRVFRRLEAEMDSLKAEMENIEAEIQGKTDAYKQRLESLDSEITRFNSCANTAGCFTSEWQFRTRRNELVAESQRLDDLYDEIDGLIDKYNEDVEKYNNDVLHNNRLMKIVNSNETVEKIE